MRLISFKQLRPEKGIEYSRDHLRRMCAEGRFPKPVRLSAARIYFKEDEIDAYIEQRAAERAA